MRKQELILRHFPLILCTSYPTAAIGVRPEYMKARLIFRPRNRDRGLYTVRLILLADPLDQGHGS
jgi:hypothetical protein